MIRERWPNVDILLRSDSGFARENLMRRCEGNAVACLDPFVDRTTVHPEPPRQLRLRNALFQSEHPVKAASLATGSRRRRCLG